MIESVIKPQLLWPTPTLAIDHKNIDELNEGLARIVLEKEREIIAKGSPKSVAGLKEGLTAHWLEYNVLNWKYPEIEEFRRLVLNGIREFFTLIGDPDDPGLKISGISCWANVLRFSQTLEVHHHDPAFVSAHYTVRCGKKPTEATPAEQDAEAGGETVYFRPGFLDRSHGGDAAGPTSPWDSDWRIIARPTAGKLFLFPSYVRHEVRPNFGERERISIAMDVFVKRQNALIYFGPPRWYVP
jgi:hypothetical protein